MPKKVEFTRHIFATLTYARDDVLSTKWSRVSKDYNRFLQDWRRLHSQDVNYLRVVESHKDGYPHIHAIIQFPSANIRVNDGRYFDRELYQRWRLLWKHGHSDYQKPRRAGIAAISYVMKYLLKNQTKKTVWRKILTTSNPVITAEEDATSIPIEPSSNIKPIVKTPTHMHGVKLCTWSRSFDFTVFMARRPESIVKGLKY